MIREHNKVHGSSQSREKGSAEREETGLPQCKTIAEQKENATAKGLLGNNIHQTERVQWLHN
jgi:hypothetical protein